MRRHKVVAAVAGGVLILVVGLTVIGLVAGDDDPNSSEEPSSSETSAPTDLPPGGSYSHPTGCFSFEPDEQWEQIEETGLDVTFSADPDAPVDAEPEPGEPGVFVGIGCAPLDQVGGSGPVAIPGAELVDEADEPFGGGTGIRLEYLTEDTTEPQQAWLSLTIDRDGTRCFIRAVGSAEAVDAIREDYDAAAATLVCNGR